MSNHDLYEQIPANDFPIRLHNNKNSDYTYPLHWHEHLELHFIFSGSAKLRCGEKYLELEQNDCAVINSGELHECAGGKCCYGCMILPPAFRENDRVIFHSLIRDDTVSELFKKIYSCFGKTEPCFKLRIKGFAFLLLSYLTENYAAERLSDAEYLERAKRLEPINKAIEYIGKNYTQDITSEAIARYVHMSSSHFCRLFKAAAGRTPKKYINDLRMSKAEDLLKYTAMTITETAMSCGYSDPNYFARIFRQVHGKSPNEYRKDIL